MSFNASRCRLLPDLQELPDHRNFFYAAPVELAGAIEFDRRKQKLDDFTPSRLFITNECFMEHSLDVDSAAMIRDGIESVARQGDRPEREWHHKGVALRNCEI